MPNIDTVNFEITADDSDFKEKLGNLGNEAEKATERASKGLSGIGTKLGETEGPVTRLFSGITAKAAAMSSTDKTKLDGITAGAQPQAVTSVQGRTGAVTLAKSDIGLGSVDDTADADKHVATAASLGTARTIRLSGAVSGEAAFDGTTDVTITCTGDTEAAGFLAAHPVGSYHLTSEPGNPGVTYGGTWESAPSEGPYAWQSHSSPGSQDKPTSRRHRTARDTRASSAPGATSRRPAGCSRHPWRTRRTTRGRKSRLRTARTGLPTPRSRRRSSMSNCASDVLSIAAGEIGYDRHDDPDEGSKYGRYYAGVTGSPYFGTTGVPYCAMGRFLPLWQGRHHA